MNRKMISWKGRFCGAGVALLLAGIVMLAAGCDWYELEDEAGHWGPIKSTEFTK